MNNLNNYEEQKESRKKLWLCTLLVLLLGMSTVGVAYAYSTTYGITENPVVTDYFSIYISDEDGAEVTSKITGEGTDFDIYTKVTDGTVQMFSDGTTFSREFYVFVESDKDCQYTVSVTIEADGVLSKIIEIESVDDIVIDGNTATKITATFNVNHGVDLSTVGLTTDTTVRANINAVNDEIQTHYLTFTVTATPVE